MNDQNKSQPNQSLVGYIRQNLAEIETQIYNGIYQESIVKELEKKGFKTNLKSFRVLLSRARKSINEKNNKIDNNQINKSQVKKEETIKKFVYKDASQYKEEELI